MTPAELDAAFKGYLRLIGRTSRLTQPRAEGVVVPVAQPSPLVSVMEMGPPLSSHVDAVAQDIFDERDEIATRQADDEKKLWDGE